MHGFRVLACDGLSPMLWDSGRMRVAGDGRAWESKYIPSWARKSRRIRRDRDYMTLFKDSKPRTLGPPPRPHLLKLPPSPLNTTLLGTKLLTYTCLKLGQCLNPSCPPLTPKQPRDAPPGPKGACFPFPPTSIVLRSPGLPSMNLASYTQNPLSWVLELILETWAVP